MDTPSPAALELLRRAIVDLNEEGRWQKADAVENLIRDRNEWAIAAKEANDRFRIAEARIEELEALLVELGESLEEYRSAEREDPNA